MTTPFAACDATTSDPEAASLFLVVLGGRTASSHIELHDVRFVAGHGIEDTFAELRRQWFGARQGLHLDAWMAVRAIDGWSVRLQRRPPGKTGETPAGAGPPPPRLWFVNLGGYSPDSLAELHQFGLVVASSAQAARASVRHRWLPGALEQHKDDLHSIDDCLAIEQLPLIPGEDEPWQVQLQPHPQGLSQPQRPDWFGYRPI